MGQLAALLFPQISRYAPILALTDPIWLNGNRTIIANSIMAINCIKVDL